MKSADWSWQIQRHRLNGRGTTQTIATNAALAATAGDDLFYATGSTGPAGKTHYVIHRRHGGTGPDQQIVHGWGTGTARISNLTAGDGRVVWTVNAPDAAKGWFKGENLPGHIYVLDLTSSQVTQIVTKDEAGENYSFAFGPRQLLWGNGSGNGDPSEYLLELDTGKLYRLGAMFGLSSVLASPNGSLISWRKPCPTKRVPARNCEERAHWAG
jgi:hypothetical protein